MRDDTLNQFSGTAHNVVQARDIFGDVYLGQSQMMSSVPAPRQLPADVAHFTNREQYLAELDALLSQGGNHPSVMVVSAIAGTAGVGKTALAVHWAHGVRNHFPDGDLYINLRGYDPQPPVDPGQALDAFIRAFNVPAEKIPVDVSNRAALYRTLVDRRRILIVLDNAAAPKQVRPLLPGSPTCVVVVTSRSRLNGLTIRDGANLLTLDLLPPEQALALLVRIIRQERVDTAPESARELVRLCAQLPLAIRIAGERITARPDATLAELVEELTDERNRIEAFSDEEDDATAIRAVFSWSYKALSPQGSRMFRLLGLHAGPEISTMTAAVLADTAIVRARGLMESLAKVHLITRLKRDRYQFHDLLRAYAAECAEQDEPDDERERAIQRVLAWYLYSLDATDRVLAPHRSQRVPLHLPRPSQELLPSFSTPNDALEWCEVERANLVAATRQAADSQQDAVAWQLPAIMGEFLFQRRYWTEFVTTHKIGLAGARHLDDQVGVGWMLTNLGLVHGETGQLKEAVNDCEQALIVLREIGNQLVEGIALTNLVSCNPASFTRPPGPIKS